MEEDYEVKIEMSNLKELTKTIDEYNKQLEETIVTMDDLGLPTNIDQALTQLEIMTAVAIAIDAVVTILTLGGNKVVEATEEVTSEVSEVTAVDRWTVGYREVIKGNVQDAGNLLQKIEDAWFGVRWRDFWENIEANQEPSPQEIQDYLNIWVAFPDAIENLCEVGR
jgi:uncharacterized protein YdiU (UPF0061 family)